MTVIVHSVALVIPRRDIKCGHCKEYHATVDEVRNCRLKPEETPPTQRQLDYLDDLIKKHPGCGLYANDCGTKQQASAMITALLGMPSSHVIDAVAYGAPTPLTAVATVRTPSSGWIVHTDLTTGVPKGRYCIDIDGTQKFYRWQISTHGRHKGKWYLNQQASDRFDRVPFLEWPRIFKTIIMQDIDKSRIRYGQLLEHCGVCGKALTNKVSRDYGIGPECRGKYGFA